jgi:hypothetical protein
MPAASAGPLSAAKIESPVRLFLRMPILFLRFHVTSAAATTDSKRDRQCSDEHDAFDEILRVVRDVEHRQPVEHDAYEDGANDSAQNVGVTFVEHGKPDERGRDAIEKQG